MRGTIKISVLLGTALTLISATIIMACHKNKSTPKPAPITIGQNYAGGIVFHVDTSGQHGLVCAPVDQSTAIIYGRDSIGTFPEDGAFGSGQANTTRIVAILGAGNYAAYLCDTLTLNGYNDWFLPSLVELDSMLYNLAVKGLANLESNEYWSSTFFGTLHGSSGTITNWGCSAIYDPSLAAGRVVEDFFYDYSFYHVRAIRAF
jgi:hypothetical protein